MAFKKPNTPEEPEIVGLMDIIFLLLIFGMIVSVAFSSTIDGGSTLREIKTLKIDLLRVEETDGTGYTLLNISIPFQSGSITKSARFADDAELISQIRQYDYSGAAFDSIQSCLSQYNNEVQAGDNIENFIKITTDSKIPFGIIDYIMNQCAGYEETLQWVKISVVT